MRYCVDDFFNHEKFRAVVKRELKSKKVSYNKLADEIGYTRDAIAHYMSGTDSKFLPIAIAEFLDIDI